MELTKPPRSGILLNTFTVEEEYPVSGTKDLGGLFRRGSITVLSLEQRLRIEITVGQPGNRQIGQRFGYHQHAQEWNLLHKEDHR